MELVSQEVIGLYAFEVTKNPALSKKKGKKKKGGGSKDGVKRPPRKKKQRNIPHPNASNPNLNPDSNPNNSTSKQDRKKSMLFMSATERRETQWSSRRERLTQMCERAESRLLDVIPRNEDGTLNVQTSQIELNERDMEDLKDFNDLTAMIDRHDRESQRNLQEEAKEAKEKKEKETVELTDVRVYLDDSLSFTHSRYSIEFFDIPYVEDMDVRMLRTILRKRVIDKQVGGGRAVNAGEKSHEHEVNRLMSQVTKFSVVELDRTGEERVLTLKDDVTKYQLCNALQERRRLLFCPLFIHYDFHISYDSNFTRPNASVLVRIVVIEQQHKVQQQQHLEQQDPQEPKKKKGEEGGGGGRRLVSDPGGEICVVCRHQNTNQIKEFVANRAAAEGEGVFVASLAFEETGNWMCMVQYELNELQDVECKINCWGMGGLNKLLGRKGSKK
eukprot:CAMPEP_0201513726 /NCGR_PEP_ID=MMETSP0161_2-20130828/5718_1 /ASSEMBLY_ACC=CAM_ASM_000251 /TAXON_ID=180227 /ORGANISM="Neoparamoeba aestuarina, Strain SoJaBio B1-5/56/2" /LENGTH=443 /DNA_ID=CAMNT_0047910041 /DNA_START=68 /DNA_END=1399 /DNA_ORIENTATION=+